MADKRNGILRAAATQENDRATNWREPNSHYIRQLSIIVFAGSLSPTPGVVSWLPSSSFLCLSRSAAEKAGVRVLFPTRGEVGYRSLVRNALTKMRRWHTAQASMSSFPLTRPTGCWGRLRGFLISRQTSSTACRREFYCKMSSSAVFARRARLTFSSASLLSGAKPIALEKLSSALS